MRIVLRLEDIFDLTVYECSQIEIFDGLTTMPRNWNIEETERLLKENE